MYEYTMYEYCLLAYSLACPHANAQFAFLDSPGMPS